MTADWENLVGRTINGAFPLLRLLGSSERSAVFLSRAATLASSDVAFKLVAAIPGRAELLLPRWRSAAELDHPHLLRLFEAGECQVGEQRYLYSVMEYAEQNLAQLLEHRALAPNEVREMLGPTLNALEFLHGSKRVHGGLKPSNVLVVGEQVKLASDSIGPASDVVSNGGGRVSTLSPYQPPEAGGGARSAAGDVWALGVLTCEALTCRRPAGLHALGGSIVLPPNIPSTFREMILKCLSGKPEDRPDVASLQAWQKGGEIEPTPAASAAPTPTPAAALAPALAPASGREAGLTPVAAAPGSSPAIRLVIRAELKPQDEIAEPVELKPQWRPMRLIIAAAVLLAIVGAGSYFLASGETPAEANAPVATPRVAAEAPRPEVASSQVPAPEASAPDAPPPPVPAPRPAASNSLSTLNEVIPDVPRSASQTIRGTVRVSVRVTVDEHGNVVGATSEDPGPSRYFERLSLEASKKWLFVPAETGGKRLLLVKFNYTRSGTTAKVTSPTP